MASLPDVLGAPLPAVGPAPPYLTRWLPTGSCRSWPLSGGVMTVGRAPCSDVVIEDDLQVSRLHLTLECVSGEWTLVDNGLSRNGTFVNGRRVSSRIRLQDRDQIQAGRTVLTFCAPGQVAVDPTLIGRPLPAAARVTAAQRAVLLALCRPYLEAQPYPTPATNNEIAAELVLSVDAVKTHLRALFHAFGIDDLPQNSKRTRLAELAQQYGLVGRADR